MYLLTKLTADNAGIPHLVSKKKETLVKWLKDKGYYWSKDYQMYIDDRPGMEDSNIDYTIEKVEEIT